MANNEEALFEEIALYLEGKLKGQALLNFEARLNSDKGFAKDFAIHEKLYLLQERNGAEAKKIRATLQEIHQEEIAKPDGRRVLLRRRLSIAAGFLLLIGIGLLIYNLTQNTGIKDRTELAYNNLFSKYAEYNLLSITTRSNQGEAALGKILEDSFRDKKYEIFLVSCEEYLAKHPDDYDVLLAKAISEIETGKFDAALKSLDELQRSDVRNNKAKWYKALLFLKKGDVDNCRKYLKEIIAEGSYNADEAGELLGELEQ